MNTQNCLNCRKSFEAKRSTAKFCSDICRATSAKKQIKIPEGEKPKPQVRKSTGSVFDEIVVTQADIETMNAGLSNYDKNIRKQKCGF